MSSVKEVLDKRTYNEDKQKHHMLSVRKQSQVYSESYNFLEKTKHDHMCWLFFEKTSVLC